MENRNTNGSNWGKWDLHIHSNASDGKNNPTEIINKAKDSGIDVIALTDHHTVDNIDEIKRIGKEQGITVISGIEFRTENGKKSVHIIGLFPDQYNGIILDQEALYDNVLAPLGLSRANIRKAGREDNQALDDDNAYKKGLLKVAVDFRNASNKIREFGGIVTVHAGGKSNSIDVEMQHEGTGGSNVSELVDSLGPVKQELMEKYVDICEVRKASEAKFYLKQFGKPSIAASDAHKINEIARNYVWIKGETTFEGLQQIIYEPEIRTRIQVNRPDDKSDYNVIESLEINETSFKKQIIPFNEGLNSIIGGRSSGKSILLSSIAKLGGSKTQPKQKVSYNNYVDSIIPSMRLIWKDHREIDKRRVEFFPQNYINSLASNPTQISQIILRILNEDTNHEQKLRKLNESLTLIEREILDKLTTYSRLQQEYTLRSQEVLKTGDRQGIEAEIAKIESQLAEIKNRTGSGLSPDEDSHFQECTTRITVNTSRKKEKKSVIEQLYQINDMVFLIPIDSFLSSLPSAIGERIRKIYENEAEIFCKRISNAIQNIIEEEQADIKSLSDDISRINSDPVFLREQEHYNANQEFFVLNDRLIKEQNKLSAVIAAENTRDKLKKSLLYIESRLISLQKSYYDKQKEYCAGVILEEGDLTILPYTIFRCHQFEYFADNFFDKRQGVNQYLFNYYYNNHEQFEGVLERCYHELRNQTLQLKRGFNYTEAIQTLLQTNWFEVKYNIQYQGDDLSSMSEGKSAFVVLRLLLDFSKEECPILIDQPEDELDNRAIYSELVTYLRKKKRERQIILVSHNPNIVVGADSEEVIVANKHGVTSPNQESTVFEYLSGALENSYYDNNAGEDSPILLRQGIREHVCEILEGGRAAFEARERKYHFSNQ